MFDQLISATLGRVSPVLADHINEFAANWRRLRLLGALLSLALAIEFVAWLITIVLLFNGHAMQSFLIYFIDVVALVLTGIAAFFAGRKVARRAKAQANRAIDDLDLLRRPGFTARNPFESLLDDDLPGGTSYRATPPALPSDKALGSAELPTTPRFRW